MRSVASSIASLVSGYSDPAAPAVQYRRPARQESNWCNWYLPHTHQRLSTEVLGCWCSTFSVRGISGRRAPVRTHRGYRAAVRSQSIPTRTSDFRVFYLPDSGVCRKAVTDDRLVKTVRATAYPRPRWNDRARQWCVGCGYLPRSAETTGDPLGAARFVGVTTSRLRRIYEFLRRSSARPPRASRPIVAGSGTSETRNPTW